MVIWCNWFFNNLKSANGLRIIMDGHEFSREFVKINSRFYVKKKRKYIYELVIIMDYYALWMWKTLKMSLKKKLTFEKMANHKGYRHKIGNEY